MTTRLGWVFAICLVATQAQAKVIRGVVTDAATGEPLPAATVWVLGTYDGTVTNSEGEYVLALSDLPAVVEVRYIGYRSQRHGVDEAAADIQDFALEPLPVELEALVVTAGHTGRDIMRKVIAQKQTWWHTLNTFRVEAYSRFVWRNASGIVAIVESLSDGFWDRKKGWREVIKDKRETKNLDFGFTVPAAEGVNLYADETELGGHNLVGVTHPKALDHYDFVLKGRRKMDDRIVYDIDVKPKHRLNTAFEGRVAVLDSVYALVEAELTPNQAFLFPMPIRDFTITLRQQFGNFGGDFWFPVGLQQTLHIEIGMPGLEFPRISGRRISRLTGYEVNVDLPDSLYERRAKVVMDSARVEQDSLLTQTALAVPLDEIEQAAYTHIDSTMTLHKAFKPKGLLARFIKLEEDGRREKPQKQKKHGRRKLTFSVKKPEVWFNRVDGWHLGSGISSRSKRTRTTFGGAYNFGLGKWSFSGNATVRWGAGERAFASIAGFNGTDVRYRSRLYGRFWMSARQILGSEDYFDFYWRKGVKATVGYRFGRPRRTGVRLTGGVNIEQHTSVDKTTDWHLSGDMEVQRPNPAIDPGLLRSAFFRVDLGDQNPGPAFLFGQRKFVVEVEHSRPGFGSDFAFTQIRMSLDWRLKTLFKRRLLPNVLDVRVFGSAFTGTLPRQRFEILDILSTKLSTFGAFRAQVGRPFEGEKLLGVFWEHNFRTVPFEWIGWRWVVERNIGLIVHGAHGRTWFDDPTLAGLDYTPRYLDRFHHELGVSINGLFGLLRVNLTRRLDTSEFCLSAEMARLF